MAFGIDDAVATGLKIIDKFIPDPQAKIAAEAELRRDLLTADGSQNKVNEQQAAHASMFVAGPRPFFMWVCGFALAYQYLLVPIGMWAAFVIGKPIPKPPVVLDSVLWELIFGMLGLAGARTYEKIKGVAK
jgi:hypothetical protein